MAQVVSLATVQQTIAAALGKFPRERARIERAAVLIALGHVAQTSPSSFAVKSQTDADVAYAVTNDGCPCIDAQRHPNQSCKHQWSVDILIAAQERQRRLDARETERARRAAFTADRVALAYARAIGFGRRAA